MNAGVRTTTQQLVWDAAVVGALGPVYFATLLPGIGYAGDTALFQFVGRTLGVPHPTGYPTYLILNWLFTHLVPVGNLAFRVNLLSAVFAVLTCVVLRRLGGALGAGPAASLAVAVGFGLTPTFWSQAIVAEVYTLHALFVVATLALFLRWSATRRQLYFWAGCVVYAVSFGNHMTTVTLLPALFFLVWRTNRSLFFEPLRLAGVAGIVLIAASQYGYLLWRSHDVTTPYLGARILDLGDLISYVTGGSFRGSMFKLSPAALLLDRGPLMLRHLIVNSLVLPFLSVVGWIALRAGARAWNGFLLLAFAGNLAFALGYDIPDVEVYLIPCGLVIASWAIVGIDQLPRRLNIRSRTARAAVLAAVPALFFSVNVGAVSQRQNRGIARELQGALDRIDSKAVILSPNYHVSEFLWYYLIGENYRARDLYLMPHYFGEGERSIAREVRAYLVDGISFEVVEQRLKVPTGLPLYCLCSRRQQADLTAAGFQLVAEATPGLFHIILPATDP